MMLVIMLPKIMISNDEKHAKIYPEFEYKLQFDGCSKSNPGIAGAGAVIYKFDKELSSKVQFVGFKSTNNMAEYTGLIIGLKLAIQLGIKSLAVEGDSLLVINQMNGIYKVKSQNLMELNNQAKQLTKQFDNIIFRHIYRTNNKRADELSNIAITNNNSFDIDTTDYDEDD